MANTVLIVDDSNFMRSKIRAILEEEGYQVVAEASNGEQAIDLALKHHPVIITLDNILPDMHGTEILRTIRSGGNKSCVVMISAVGQQSTIEEGKSLGASAYIVKPFNKEDIMEALRNCARG